MDKERGLIRAAGSMSVMTTLSRIAGYFRDSLQAAILGAANSSDAFVIAYRIPNMLRRLVGEGALTSAFVPTFARYLRAGDRKALWRFSSSVLYAMAAVLAVITALGIALSPWLVRLLAWGFTVSPEKMALTVSLNRLMFPYIFFISLAALVGGVLNAFDVFALPAFTPVLLNLSIIVMAWLLRDRFADPAYGFAIGVILGGFLQLAVQIPALLRQGMSLRPPDDLDLDGLREIGRLILPRVFGVGIIQVNLVIDSQFATSLQSGSVSFLYYANRVTELALGIFVISLSTVILPTLSRATAEQDRESVRSILSTAMRLLMFISIPATLGLIVLRVPIIQVLFERGRFTHEDTVLTSGALAFYAIGLLPYAGVSVLATAFYAHRDTRTPVKIGALTFFLHLALNFALRGPMRHGGIALSTSISALADAALLAFMLRRRAGNFLDRDVVRTAWHTLAGGAAMTASLLLALLWVNVVSLQGIGAQALALGALIAGGGAVYVLVLVLLGSQEVRLLASVVRPPR
ncbi:MAG TPA: murein biosynthesis integral membrane protein MurJ [Candidatus Polarisedimenticolia bacterium]|jgi:putative peptidoglycan lipid II flippase|nr:murein biosynthesis integral membrane protein MurJ [Candidatus Polarisedimenticolia bacterium]